MTKVILARHGIYGNPENIIPFRSNDVSLTQEGIEQIERNANFLRSFNISQIYSSPVKRCVETAQIFSRILNVGINYEEDLSEVDSPYQNTPQAEYKKLMESNSVYANEFHLSHGGETYEQVIERVERILKKVLDENKEQNVIIVSHGDPIMLLAAKLEGIDFDINMSVEDQIDYIRKGQMIELDFNGHKLTNYTKHYF